MAKSKNLSIRLSLKDQAVVERALVQLGDRGQNALKRIERASRPASKGLLAVGAVGREVRGGLEGLALQSGAAGAGLTALGPAGLAAAAAIGAVILAVRGLVQASRQSLDFAANIKAQAETAGLAVEAYQELTFAAEKYNVTQDALTDGMKELILRADEYVVTAKGPAEEAFRRLGFTQDELKGKLKNTSALFSEVIERMEGLDRAAQIRVADEIFGGTAGEQFVRFLDEGAAGIEKFRQEARDLGVVMDASLIEKGDQARDKMVALEKVISVQMNSALVDMAPLLTFVTQAFADMAAGIQITIDKMKDLENQSTGRVSQRLDELDVELAGQTDRLQRAKKDLDKARAILDDPAANPAHKKIATVELSGIEARFQKEKEAYERLFQEREEALEILLTKAEPKTTSKPVKLGFNNIELPDTSALERTVENLKFQKDQLERTDFGQAFNTALKSAASAGEVITPEVKQQIHDYVLAIQTLKAEEEERKRLTRERATLEQEGERTTERLRTASEAYGFALSEINGLLAKGVINEETATRARDEATLAFEDAERRKLDASKQGADGIRRALQTYSDDAGDAAKQTEQATLRSLTSIEDAFVAMATGSKVTFGDMVNSIVADLARITIRKTITEPLANSFLDFLPFKNGAAFSGGNVVPFANGAAFRGGRVNAFANGTVVTQPTFFPMAGNETGVMGEAGDEAIMPLRRGPGGRLGVDASGMGGGGSAMSVHIETNVSVEGGSQGGEADGELAQRIGQAVEGRVTQIVDRRLMQQMKNGGMLNPRGTRMA